MFLGYVFLPGNAVNMLYLFMLMKLRLGYIPVISAPHFSQTECTKLASSTPNVQKCKFTLSHMPTTIGVQESAWRLRCWGIMEQRFSWDNDCGMGLRHGLVVDPILIWMWNAGCLGHFHGDKIVFSLSKRVLVIHSCLTVQPHGL